MGPTTRDLIRSSAAERARAAVDCQSQSCHVAGGKGVQFVFRTLKHRVVLSLFHCSHSIKLLHYIGNVETQDRHPVRAP